MLTIIAALIAGQHVTDQVVPIRKGQLQCVQPNQAAKTCAALSRFELASGDSLRVHTQILLDPDRSITVEMTAPARLENGAICGVYEESYILSGIVREKGKTASPDLSETLLGTLAEASRAQSGKNICTKVVQRSDTLVQVATVDGVPDPAMDLPMLWVSSSEGYRLGL